MKRTLNFLLVSVTFSITMSACLPSKNIGTSGEGDYSENIERYRSSYADSLANASENTVPTNVSPKPETPTVSGNMTTQYAINDQMNDFLYAVTNRNQSNNSYQGYTVQVYTGSSREKASDAKNKVYGLLPDVNPVISFDPPNYKVKIGEYTNRLDAQPVYAALKNAFPVVLIVPERFPVVAD